MAEETKREASARKKIPKLDEQQRAAVARELRRINDKIKDEINPALKLVTEAVNLQTLSTNEELAELEAAFDVLREAAKDVAYKNYKEKTELLLLSQLDDKDLPKFSVTGAGTITSSTTNRWSMKDPRAVIEAAKKLDNFDVFTTSISNSECESFYKETGKKFPGTDFYPDRKLSFTKEKPKKGK